MTTLVENLIPSFILYYHASTVFQEFFQAIMLLLEGSSTFITQERYYPIVSTLLHFYQMYGFWSTLHFNEILLLPNC